MRWLDLPGVARRALAVSCSSRCLSSCLGIHVRARADRCHEAHHTVVFLLSCDDRPNALFQDVRHSLIVDFDDVEALTHREVNVLCDTRLSVAIAFEQAAKTERQGVEGLQVVDLHPWVAAPAEHPFKNGHREPAILAAAQNLEVRWREKLGASNGGLTRLAEQSFTADLPTASRPRLRYPLNGSDPESDAWKNAHMGTMDFAKGCARRIRNLGLHHPSEQEPEAEDAIEVLSALSALANWVAEAQVQRCS